MEYNIYWYKYLSNSDKLKWITNRGNYSYDSSTEWRNFLDHEQTENMCEFIEKSFVWSETPEGHQYWSNIRDKRIQRLIPHKIMEKQFTF